MGETIPLLDGNKRRAATNRSARYRSWLILIALLYFGYRYVNCIGFRLPWDPWNHWVDPTRVNGDSCYCALGTYCWQCRLEVPQSRRDLPAIGLDLTDAYGTATVILPSHEIINVGPIYGGKHYANAMIWFSTTSARHTAPPYNKFEYDVPRGGAAGLYDIPRETLRSFRKALGLPASSQVGALAAMIKALRKEAAASLLARNITTPVEAVTISSIDLPGLYDEDLFDAAQYAGLSTKIANGPPIRDRPFNDVLLSDLNFRRQPKHVDAAFIAHGFGLCEHYRTGKQCSLEEDKFQHQPTKHVFSVQATQAGVELSWTWSWMITARTDMLYWQQHETWYETTLGISRLEAVTQQGQADLKYWKLFQTFVANMVNETFGQDRVNVTDVFMIGENATVPGLRDNVMRAIMDLKNPYQHHQPMIHVRGGVESLFIASQGAAEISRRVLDAPTGCGSPRAKAKGSARVCLD